MVITGPLPLMNYLFIACAMYPSAATHIGDWQVPNQGEGDTMSRRPSPYNGSTQTALEFRPERCCSKCLGPVPYLQESQRVPKIYASTFPHCEL